MKDTPPNSPVYAIPNKELKTQVESTVFRIVVGMKRSFESRGFKYQVKVVCLTKRNNILVKRLISFMLK